MTDPQTEEDDDRYADYAAEYDDERGFQPLKKQTGKPQTVKDTRKQQGKEFGRAVHKYFKQRGKRDKP